MPPPALAFYPFVPLPHVFPFDDPFPLPTLLFFFLAAGLSHKPLKVKSTYSPLWVGTLFARPAVTNVYNGLKKEVDF